MPKLQYNPKSNQYLLNIPKLLVKFKRLEKGQEIRIIENDRGEIVLEPTKEKQTFG